MFGGVMRAGGGREDEWSLTLIAYAELETRRPLLPLDWLSREEKWRGHGLLLPWGSASSLNGAFHPAVPPEETYNLVGSAHKQWSHWMKMTWFFCMLLCPPLWAHRCFHPLLSLVGGYWGQTISQSCSSPKADALGSKWHLVQSLRGSQRCWNPMAKEGHGECL